MIQRFALPDASGNIAGFYSDDIHEVIPAGAIAIEHDQWQACLNEPGRWVIVDGAIAHSPTWAPPQPPPAWLTARQQAYPSIQTQLDTLYHGGFDAWRSSIEAIKYQHPKP